MTCVSVEPPVAFQGLLQKLGAAAAAAALFLGGYGAGLASSNMYADVQTAELHKVEYEQQQQQQRVPVTPVSLTLPDQVT